MAELCKNRIMMGDQGIFYCPDCMECECCTPEWSAKHATSDYECVVIDDDGCIFKGNHNFPRHACSATTGLSVTDTASSTEHR